jgi:hypothetical protein
MASFFFGCNDELLILMTRSTLQELTSALVADGVSRDKILTNY